MHPTVPHLAVPFSMAGSRAATVEDGTVEEVTQNVRVILSTIRGERLAVPDFGLDNPVFRTGATPSPAEVEAVVGQYEPRAQLRLDYAEPTSDGEAALQVYVSMEEG